MNNDINSIKEKIKKIKNEIFANHIMLLTFLFSIFILLLNECMFLVLLFVIFYLITLNKVGLSLQLKEKYEILLKMLEQED